MPAQRTGSVLTISIKPELAAELRAQAAHEHRTISAIVSLSLEAYLRDADKPAAAPRRRMVRPA